MGKGSYLVDQYKKAYEKVEIYKFMEKVTPKYKPNFDALNDLLHREGFDSMKVMQTDAKELGQTEIEYFKVIGLYGMTHNLCSRFLSFNHLITLVGFANNSMVAEPIQDVFK